MKINLKHPLFVLAAGLLLVTGGAFGATKAADVDKAHIENVVFETASIGVKLQEDRSADPEKNDYVTVAAVKNGKEVTGELEFISLASVKDGKENLVVETPYPENIRVVNPSEKDSESDGSTGPEYVRVVIRKYWVDENGKKDTTLDPSIIKLNKTSDWGEIDLASGEEVIYYSKKPIDNTDNKNTSKVIESITFDEKILDDVTKTTKKTETEKGYIIESSSAYDYDGKTFKVEVRVDAVQTHSAKEAILGAWGVEAQIDSNGTIVMIDGTKL